MKYQEIISSCYCGNGSQKLEIARILRENYGEALTVEKTIQSQLKRLRTLVESLDSHMASMDMGRTCTRCAATVKGGCCSDYMGDENSDALLLLMNILAGVDVRLIGHSGDDCCFLAERGCLLLFKPIFCLNYLCGRIQKESDMDDLKILEQKSGELLTAQANLEQVLIGFLQLHKKNVKFQMTNDKCEM